jgi:hypothetical protein
MFTDCEAEHQRAFSKDGARLSMFSRTVTTWVLFSTTILFVCIGCRTRQSEDAHLCRSLFDSDANGLVIRTDKPEGDVIDIKKATVKVLSVTGSEPLEAVRARIVGHNSAGVVSDLTLFAFHKEGDWPVVLSAAENSDVDSLTPVIGYAKRKTKYVEAPKFPYEERHIIFPSAALHPASVVKRTQSWNGSVEFTRPGKQDCLSKIKIDMVFTDNSGKTRAIKGEIDAVHITDGFMPSKKSFGAEPLLQLARWTKNREISRPAR